MNKVVLAVREAEVHEREREVEEQRLRSTSLAPLVK